MNDRTLSQADLSPSVNTPAITRMARDIRIACVQHGDYAEAERITEENEPEPYFGMHYSVGVLSNLVDSVPHLILSLDAPASHKVRGDGIVIGLPYPKLPRPIPGRVATALHIRRIVRLLKAFHPTHLLLRTGGQTALGVLEAMRGISPSTLVIFANVFIAESKFDERVLRRLGQRLNDSHIKLVGNHRWPATQSMLEWGVEESKTRVWDWPGVRRPEDFAIKSYTGRSPYTVFYAGKISFDKGVGDLIEAASRVREKVRLVIAGSGPDGDALQQKARTLGVSVDWLGRVGNDAVFNNMLASEVVCVPSRREFREGMPLTLTEALASRTPVVCSDHPVFSKAFIDGEGLVIFKAGDPASLVHGLERVTGSANVYQELSESTAAAFARVDCKTTFGDLIEEWSAMQ